MKEKNKFCIKCGRELSADAHFCNTCGTKVEETNENISSEINIAIEKPKRGRPKKIVEPVFEEVKEEHKEESSSERAKTSNEKPLTSNYEESKDSVEIVYNAKNKEVSGFEKNKKYIYPVIAIVITFVLCLIAFTCFYEYYMKHLVIETTKREVTVTDTGISEAVEKVYDAVVVVESYDHGNLFATGTGFVYKKDDKNAYILTNNHVVEDADEIRVVFTDNRREKVEIVGTEEYSDVALLGLSKDKIISVAELGSSDDSKLGDTAFAVGAPLDSETYAWSVTRGIISGKNRTVTITSGQTKRVMEVLQTDAAINNGNSGGPLCNSNGQVIGITNLKLASSAIEGMGFAIPIETAIKYAEKFINGEKIVYPYIGISMYDATPNYMNPYASGVYIERVEKNSPADKGGIKAGDKILKVNDVEISSSSFFRFELYKYEVGDTVKITVERDGKEKTLSVTLSSSNQNA